jgi:hypothetical protein
VVSQLIKDFQTTHKDGYLIDWLTLLQLVTLDALLSNRRGDVSANTIIEQALVFLDIS